MIEMSIAGTDPNFLQDQVNELQYQNKKLSELMAEVRSQQMQTEEQNGVLQNEVEKLSRRLQS